MAKRKKPKLIRPDSITKKKKVKWTPSSIIGLAMGIGVSAVGLYHGTVNGQPSGFYIVLMGVLWIVLIVVMMMSYRR